MTLFLERPIRLHETSNHERHQSGRVSYGICRLAGSARDQLDIEQQIPMDFRRQFDRQLHGPTVGDGIDTEFGHGDAPSC
jgi:hypothetical protein